MSSPDFIDSLDVPQRSHNIVQILSDYQLPSGPWTGRRDIEELNGKAEFGRLPLHYIRTPYVSGSFLAVEQLNSLQFKRLNSRVLTNWKWVNHQFSSVKTSKNQRARGNWFTVWPTSFNSQIQGAYIDKIPHLSYTALSGIYAILNIDTNKYPKEILHNILQIPWSNILSLQQKHKLSGWLNSSDHLDDHYVMACCTELCKRISQLPNERKQPYQYAYLKGINWLRQELADNDYYFVHNGIRSSYLTAMVLLRIHHLLPKEFLWNALQNLVENNQHGTWVDESIINSERREHSRYSTTICVVDLFAKLSFRHRFIRESAFTDSLKFIFDKDIEVHAEPQDLVFLLDILQNLSDFHSVREIIHEKDIYDWWHPNDPSNPSRYSNIKRIDEFYQPWLAQSYERSRRLQESAYSFGNGYRAALIEEEEQARQIKKLLKSNLMRLEGDKFYRITPINDPQGLRSDILNRLRSLLHNCTQINNTHHLRSLFIDQRLSPFQSHLPDANDFNEMIEKLIAFLYGRNHWESGKNGLVCFLEVLIDRLHPQDACRFQLQQLIDDLNNSKRMS